MQETENDPYSADNNDTCWTCLLCHDKVFFFVLLKYLSANEKGSIYT